MNTNKSFPAQASLRRHKSSSSGDSTVETHEAADSWLSKTAVADAQEEGEMAPYTTATTSTSSGSHSEDSSTPFIPQGDSSSSDENNPKARKREHDEVDMTEEERTEERRAKNRISAHQSRLRKRRQLKYLQHQVMILTEENKKLASTKDSAIHNLAVARAENAQLRLAQQDAMRITAALQISQGSMGGVGMFNQSFRHF
mmetsp:Transcript_3999/g.6690  ORF Transcript_3999/g.6690 Transcript_3999/m.6690 type:complete len:200 (+) Transcript_3999:32-631(+)